MLKIKNYVLGFAGFTLVLATILSNAKPSRFNKSLDFILEEPGVPPPDTLPGDTTRNRPYEPTRNPEFQPRDRFGDPISNSPNESPLWIKDNSTLETEIDTGMNYTIYEKVGDVDYRPPTEMSFEEFQRYQEQRMLRDYWKNRAAGLDGESAVSGRRLIPPIYISPVFDRIFGGSFVDIRPNGFVTLDFGARFQRIDNPAIPIRQQRNGGFEFDQQISMNVVGKIGEKLAVTANFDNNASFDFENDLKVEYTGFEEDIIKKIEIGNVSMPINNSLITGAQNLFGVKTQLQFGRLFVTGVASTQRGKGESIAIEGGAQGREFEIRASDYDDNRHFFLGHFFRENYDRWLSRLPQITSGVNITRVEVYVINRNQNTQGLRSIMAFMDLGEGRFAYRKEDPKVAPVIENSPAANGANRLFKYLTEQRAAGGSVSDTTGFERSIDFERINGARKLDLNEYSVNNQLGYISLTRKLQNDEVLAVAYEYTHNGNVYKVGELTEDYSSRPETDVIFLKMLRPTKVSVRVPTWDLMMKNIYNLNASQISRDGFQLRVIYRDDKSGIDNPSLHEGARTKDQPLVQLFGLDRLGPANDPPADGNFDFIEGVTIDPEYGTIIFPVLQPFGSQIRSYFDPLAEQNLINKYVFDTLYRSTKADAEQIAGKNKFFIVGKFQAGSSSEIVLPGIEIAEGSVRVYAGNTPLNDGTDYTVDYKLGRVRILNEGILNSGKKIDIKYERADLFSFQQRSLLGTRLDYQLNEDINLGATMLYLNERPMITRVSIGDEPTRNLQYGFDINYRKDSRFLTKLVDALPLIQTKEISTITFNGEIAQIRPGTSNKVGGEGTSYIDDFESSVIPFSLGNAPAINWKLASTPKVDDQRFGPDQQVLENSYKRAKLAWYMVDNVFYRSGGQNKPDHLDKIENHYERQIQFNEIFQRDAQVVNANEPVMDLAYFPEERGPYNFNPDLTPEGLLKNPERNWGGITRAIAGDVDFDKTNIEYIEFWMLDPFLGTKINSENAVIRDGRVNKANTTGGQLFFNLGSISEDVLKDGRHAFENGLPADYNSSQGVTDTPWGRVTTQQFLTNAFDNTGGARENQDIGLDGLKSPDEMLKFFPPGFASTPTGQAIQDDPAADDFKYYLSADHDAAQRGVVERYKNFNGLENNSPVAGGSSFTPAGSNLPNNEDLNNDNTLSELEDYYEYQINLKPGLRVGENYIVDVKEAKSTSGEVVQWYLFRVPVRQPTRVQGTINDFKSIRFIRTYLTGFSEPVVLRMARFQLVGSQWRKYQESLYEKGLNEVPEPSDPDFTISVVGYEENGGVSQTGGNRVPYVLPPGIQRDRDNNSAQERRVNEQAIQACVENLKDKDARALFKNVNLDLINYGRIKMFFHAQSPDAQNEEVTAFLRFGTDFIDNYYEVEVPLHITDYNATRAEEIWPQENEIDISFDELYGVKQRRNLMRGRNNVELPFSQQVRQYKVTVKGRPDMSSVQILMIGVRNPGSADGASKSVCIWANELRVTDFDKTAGWAANARLNAKLADFANVTASTRYVSYGYGDIQQRIAERSRSDIQSYDVSANVTLDKFIPERTGIKIPMFISYETSTITPHFDPLDPDVTLSGSLLSFETDEQRENYKRMVQDREVRRSINFTNVRKVKVNPEARNYFFDISNFAFSYAFSDITRSNINTESYIFKSYRGSVAYNYAPKELSIEPFKNIKFFSSPYLRLIGDFNFSPVPNNLSFRADLDRKFIRTQLRNNDLTTIGIDPTFEKYFTFNRQYNLRWNLTKALGIDYNATAYAIIDEPRGDINTQEKRDSIWNNVRNLGRMKNFDQLITANYQLPFEKLPFTDWIQAEANYSVGYTWTAGALDQQDSLGNVIQNNRQQGLSGKFDLVKLYNKVKILKEVNSPRPPARKGPQAKPDTAQKSDLKVLKGVLGVLMSLRSVTFNYNVQEGTMLPGYMQNVFLFGMDSSFNGPGLPFILGSQDPNIKNKVAENGWMAPSTELTTPFSQSRGVNLKLGAEIRPFQDLNIRLTADKQTQDGYQEIFRRDSANDIQGNPQYLSLTPSRSGSYRISFLSIKTAFKKDNADNTNPVFQEFERNRGIIQSRLSQNGGEYDINSQDVLIPSFIAAYSGKDANSSKLTPFPRFPLPNWNIDFAGLGKIPALKEIFTSISLNHVYSSSYQVSNYSNSLLFETDLDLSHRIEDYQGDIFQNEEGSWVPRYILGEVMIEERFAPLIGVNVRTKSRLTARVQYNKERRVGLALSNAQINELSSNDLLMEVGFIKNNLKLPFRVNGSVVTLKNEITFKTAFTIRDTKTIQRKIEDVNTVTSGNINFQLRPTINYILNQKLQLQIYFERNINEPRVSNSYKRTTTQFGVQVRFSLAQ